MSEPAAKSDRIVEARLKLMARFKGKLAETPSVSDPKPLGAGPRNRHGMPKIPVGQTVTQGWPVLDLGTKPKIPLDRWELRIDGAVARPVTLRWDDFRALEPATDISDFHCVTTWSKMDLEWGGVRFSTVLAAAEPLPEATHVMCHAADGYTTNLALEEALKDDVLLVHTVNGKPLPVEHGGPVRVITPQLYAWKGAKWVNRLELLTENKLGFWEERGYSNTARPWRNDRYA
jgi:DMSO/TMAO reductase YedYZ molybdopterin-dependent catalytic subunit